MLPKSVPPKPKSVPPKLSLEIERWSDGEAGQSPCRSPALRSEVDEGEDRNEIRSKGGTKNEVSEGDGRNGVSPMGKRESPDVNLGGDAGASTSGLTRKELVAAHVCIGILIKLLFLERRLLDEDLRTSCTNKRKLSLVHYEPILIGIGINIQRIYQCPCGTDCGECTWASMRTAARLWSSHIGLIVWHTFDLES